MIRRMMTGRPERRRKPCPPTTAHDLVVRFVVRVLAAEALIGLVVLGVVAFFEREPSELLLGAFIATVSNASGSLASVLVNTGNRGAAEGELAPAVRIEQPPGEAVPVTETA